MTVRAIAIVMGGLLAAAAPAQAQFGAPPSGTGTGAATAAAAPAAGNTCSVAYYNALEPLRSGRGSALAGLHKALRTPDPELAGKWQVSAPTTGKPKAQPKAERVCVETKDVAGQAPRCLRYELKAPSAPLDVVAKSPPTADEVRILKAAGDIVEARGALPDVGNNGRHNFLVQRVAQDLRLYAAQPQHPNLCAGAGDLAEFYAGQIQPLKKRMEEVAELARQARTLAQTRVRAIAVAELRVYDKALAEAAKVSEQRAKLLEAHKVALAGAVDAAAARPAGSPPPVLPPAPTLPPMPDVPAKPNGPADPADYGIVGLPSLVSEALRPLLPAALVQDIADEKVPAKIFQKARALMLDPQTTVPPAHADVRDAALMALRLLEARVYTDIYVARFKELDAVLSGSLGDLRAAHAGACTCRD